MYFLGLFSSCGSKVRWPLCVKSAPVISYNGENINWRKTKLPKNFDPVRFLCVSRYKKVQLPRTDFSENLMKEKKKKIYIIIFILKGL